MARGHVVVIGATAFGIDIGCRQPGAWRGVTLIHDPGFRPPPAPPGKRWRAIAQPLDDIATVIALCGRKPQCVVVATQDEMQAIALARIIQAKRRKWPLILQIEDATIGRDAALLETDLASVRIVSQAAGIAQATVTALDLPDMARLRGLPRVHVALVGLGSVNLALAQEVLERCHTPDLQPPRITILDVNVAEARVRLGRERPTLAQLVGSGMKQFDGLAGAPEHFYTLLKEIEAEGALVLCSVATGNDRRNAAIAIRLRQFQTQHLLLKCPILVRSEGINHLAPPAMRDLTGGVSEFGGQRMSRGEADMERAVAGLAQAMHEGWLDKASPVEKVDRTWEKLSTADRRPALAAALGATDTLAAGGLTPETPGELAGLRVHSLAIAHLKADSTKMLGLARREHDRWMAERRSDGHVFASLRDNEKKHHDKLVPFDDLPPENKAKDNDNVVKTLDHCDRLFRSNRLGPHWRHLVRIGVAGPLLPGDDLIKRTRIEVARALRARLPIPVRACRLEVITPAAPGFDRLGAMAIMGAWADIGGDPGRLVLMHAASPATVADIALASLPKPEGEDSGLHAREAARQQLDALDRACGGRIREIDMRPPSMSDVELRAAMGTYLAVVDQVAARMDALCDLVVYATEGGRARHTTQARDARAAGGRALLTVS